MGATFRFLALESEREVIPNWFRALGAPPRIVATDQSIVMHFSELGPLVGLPGPIEFSKSPVVALFEPARRCGALLTAGEVHFLPTPLRKTFPQLHRISEEFGRWLQRFECVYSKATGAHREWDYYLEGSIRNRDASVFALPQAMVALREGQYFVAHEDTDASLAKLCKALRLRGVEGLIYP